MSLIVRCPKCAVVYSVVPDQLKIGQGWLRCGLCQHVFDSTGWVLNGASVTFAREPGTGIPDVGAQRLRIEELLKQEDRTRTALSTDRVLSEFEDALSSFRPQRPYATPPPNSEADDQHAQRKHTAWWSYLSLALLLLGLALQSAWFQRQALSEIHPFFRQAFELTCQELTCEFAPLKVQGGVVIEHSNLSPLEVGFRLNLTLRNATAQPLQMPDLELSLLDEHGKTKIRRVIRTAEVRAPKMLLPSQAWGGELMITTDEGLTFTGYKVLSFYP